MRNKVLCLAITIVIVFLLCGCRAYREADDCYIVTAIGFDGKEKVTVSVEVVSAGGSERSDKPESEIISGKGDTPMDAIFSLNNQISKNLLFDHCTAIIIGKTLSETHLDEVLKYGDEQKELNFAVDMFVCENAKKLLEDSKSVSVSRGFDITTNLKETNKEIGIDYKNKFYEVFMAYKQNKDYSFPFLKLNDKKIIIDGQSVYNEKKEKAYLDNEEAIIYSFLKNNNNGGKIYFKDEFAEIRSGKCYYNGEKNEYQLNLYIKNSSKEFIKVFKKRFQKMLEEKMQELNFKTDTVSIKERVGI